MRAAARRGQRTQCGCCCCWHEAAAAMRLLQLRQQLLHHHPSAAGPSSCTVLTPPPLGAARWLRRRLPAAACFHRRPPAAPHLVDLWVVDDLVGDEQLLVGVCVARLVRHAHRALHAPAVAVRLGQLDGHVALHPGVARLAHLRDQAAGGVADAVLLHQLLALAVLGRLAHVAARRVERAAHRAAVHLLGVSCVAGRAGVRRPGALARWRVAPQAEQQQQAGSRVHCAGSALARLYHSQAPDAAIPAAGWASSGLAERGGPRCCSHPRRTHAPATEARTRSWRLLTPASGAANRRGCNWWLACCFASDDGHCSGAILLALLLGSRSNASERRERGEHVRSGQRADVGMVAARQPHANDSRQTTATSLFPPPA